MITNAITFIVLAVVVGLFLRWILCIPTIVKRLTQIAAAQGNVDAQKALYGDGLRIK